MDKVRVEKNSTRLDAKHDIVRKKFYTFIATATGSVSHSSKLDH
uniref:Uncharacterized protein n=1 Tax=Rhizophora mucronata TaxID=61149 RepID=A0A2P2PHU4_RHIMU